MQLTPQVKRALLWSGGYLALWFLAVQASGLLGWDAARATFAQYGLGGFFLLGLGWVVWYVERVSQRLDSQRVVSQHHAQPDGSDSSTREPGDRRIWNPLDTHAWYYGGRGRKLNQSLLALASYSLVFMLIATMITQVRGCKETYELPAGGGETKALAQTVKIQKVIKKKFVINPFSAIIFNPPPIDDVKLQLTEVTQHAYKVGYGEGDGAGFAGGTNKGKVRFIRLEYSGGDWNQDFGIGADLNLLIEYGVRTSQRVNEQTEARTVAQLDAFPAEKSPPLVYLTGQRNISLSKSEVRTLREYLLDKHGMLFGDNGGSQHFHNQFFAVMRQVLPEVEPVRVPLDDVIHRIPYPLPFLPIVAPHGGKDAYGWKVDGRWLCYYHPGDIGDAWSDGHSGVPTAVWEACYQLGTNVIFYAHVEYSKWLMSRHPKK